jgi:acyl carrier protein
MEINDFIKKFAGQFEDVPVEKFTEDIEFRSLDEWGSLTALTIIAMIDEEYGVTIKGDDIRKSQTLKDLFEIVKSRI